MIEIAKTIFQAAIAAVQPRSLVSQALKVTNNALDISGRHYQLHRNVKVAAFGKAAIGMCLGAVDTLGKHIQTGIASVPIGSLSSQQFPETTIKFFEGARNNLPDEASMATAIKIKTLASELTNDDILLVLISGGGSALLPLPAPGLTLAEKQAFIKALAGSGANIEELNIVRQNLSQIKRGQLASFAYPAKDISALTQTLLPDMTLAHDMGDVWMDKTALTSGIVSHPRN